MRSKSFGLARNIDRSSFGKTNPGRPVSRWAQSSSWDELSLVDLVKGEFPGVDGCGGRLLL